MEPNSARTHLYENFPAQIMLLVRWALFRANSPLEFSTLTPPILDWKVLKVNLEVAGIEVGSLGPPPP